MIRGVGIDLLDISRIERPMKSRRFRERVFTVGELEYLSARGAESAAGLFCAKEAIAKAMGVSVMKILKTVEITHAGDGRPVVLTPENISISITHTATTAAAVAVWF